jgi:hypothetical protein
LYGRQFRNHEGRFGLFELLLLSFFPLVMFLALFLRFVYCSLLGGMGRGMVNQLIFAFLFGSVNRFVSAYSLSSL